MKRLVIGLLAHVDSGKTTLAEGLLYRAGVLRKLGRVDHRDAFLDTDSQERARGITIFAKQAVLTLPAADGCGETALTLLDTPGHVDFSAEAERALQVLDYAVLVVSGTDGVQAHTETLWKLLARYRVPTFVFVNKMDLPGADAAVRLRELRGRFGDGCVDFSTAPDPEALALCSEPLMNEVLDTGHPRARDRHHGHCAAAGLSGVFRRGAASGRPGRLTARLANADPHPAPVAGIWRTRVQNQ